MDVGMCDVRCLFMRFFFGMTMIPPLLGRFVVKRLDFCLTYMLNEDSGFHDES
jgi:hypothetical protein